MTLSIDAKVTKCRQVVLYLYYGIFAPTHHKMLFLTLKVVCNMYANVTESNSRSLLHIHNKYVFGLFIQVQFVAQAKAKYRFGNSQQRHS